MGAKNFSCTDNGTGVRGGLPVELADGDYELSINNFNMYARVEFWENDCGNHYEYVDESLNDLFQGKYPGCWFTGDFDDTYSRSKKI